MSSKQKTDILAAPGNLFVFSKLAKYSILMLVYPLAILFLLMKVILPYMGVVDISLINTISGISAVITANIVIAFYVIGAFKENIDEEKPKEE